MMRPMQGQSKKVRVSFHSGYKGEETPRSVVLKDKEFPIDRILARKRILDHKTGEVREEYKIELNGRAAILKIHESRECEIICLS
jgi:hypothetical protein